MNTRNSLTRREFLRLGAFAGAGAVLAACAPAAAPAVDEAAEPQEAEEAMPEEAPEGEMEEATMVYWTWAESNFPHFEHMAERWNEEHADGPKITFEGILVPSSSETITKGMNAMAAGSGIPDIFLIEITPFSRFLKDDPPLAEQYLMDLVPALDNYNANWQDDYIGWAPYTWQGKVYGFEVGLCPCAYYYREDLFDEQGIETPLETWDDWMAAGEQMAAAGHAMSATDYGTGHWFMTLYQAGGALFDEGGELAIEDERGLKSFELVMDGAKAEIQWMTSEYWGPPHYAALNDGTVAGVLSAIWYSPHVLKPNVEEEHVGKWRVQPLPTWKTSGTWGGPDFSTRPTSTWGGTSLTIPKSSAHPDLTFDYLAWCMLTEEGGASVYQNMGQMPMVKSVIHDDSVTNIPDDFYGGQAVNKVFADIADSIPPKYPHPYWEETSTELGNIVAPAYEGEASYEELIGQAADNVRELMATA